jgi:ribosomal 50S subunit-recycling heat shock protein
MAMSWLIGTSGGCGLHLGGYSHHTPVLMGWQDPPVYPEFRLKNTLIHHKDMTSMNTKPSKRSWAVALCVALAATGCAGVSDTAPPAPSMTSPATAQPPSGAVGADLVTTTARVKSLDQQTRRVALERADGSEVTFYADDTVRNLAQVEVGDEVTVTFYESLAYEVKKPGTATPGATMTEETARARPGEKPAGAGARVTTVVATIAGIDKSAGTVTLRGPAGRVTTIKARDPRNLERVAVGDLVEITYTEAVAISVEKPKKP